MALTGIYNLNEPLSQRGLLWERRDLSAGCLTECARKLSSSSTEQCFSIHQENGTRLIFTTHPIHTKLNVPADCNCRYISSYFYLEGRCDRWRTSFGWCCTKAPAIRKPFSAACNWVFFVTLWSLLLVASQHSYKEIVPGQYTIMCEGRINEKIKSFPSQITISHDWLHSFSPLYNRALNLQCD